jgi:hypothetical protein
MDNNMSLYGTRDAYAYAPVWDVGTTQFTTVFFDLIKNVASAGANPRNCIRFINSLDSECLNNTLDNRFNNALHFACGSITRENSAVMVSVISALIGRGINVNSHGDGFRNMIGETAFTPLHIVCELKFIPIELVELLINNGADVKLAASNNFTPLHALCHNFFAEPARHEKIDDRFNPIEIAKLLIDKGASCDSLYGDRNETPLDMTVCCSNWQLGRFLMQKNALVSEECVQTIMVVLPRQEQKKWGESAQFLNEVLSHYEKQIASSGAISTVRRTPAHVPAYPTLTRCSRRRLLEDEEDEDQQMSVAWPPAPTPLLDKISE